MKNDSYFDIDTSSPEVVSIIREDANSFKTCHLCGENKPQMMLSFITSKLDRVDRDFGDYAAFVGMGVLSTLSLLARGHSRVMTKVPGNRFYQLIPLHLGICKECIDKKTNRRGKLVLKESDYKKHPLYPRAKELGYKKVLFQESYTLEDLQGKSFQKDLLKIRKFVEEMNDGLDVPQTNIISNDSFLSNNIIDMSKKIYDEYGFDEEGYNREGYDAYGYDREGFNKEGRNKKGYDRNGYDEEGFNVKGYDEDGYDREGFNVEGYDRKGFNLEGWNKRGINKKTGKEYDEQGFDKNGKHKDTGTKYDSDGYDRDGYDKNGYNFFGISKKGHYKNNVSKIIDKSSTGCGAIIMFGIILFLIILVIQAIIGD